MIIVHNYLYRTELRGTASLLLGLIFLDSFTMVSGRNYMLSNIVLSFTLSENSGVSLLSLTLTELNNELRVLALLWSVIVFSPEAVFNIPTSCERPSFLFTCPYTMCECCFLKVWRQNVKVIGLLCNPASQIDCWLAWFTPMVTPR